MSCKCTGCNAPVKPGNQCPVCNTPVNPGNQCPVSNSPVGPGQRVFTFSEIVINERLIIPRPKPNVESIINIIRDFQINDVEVLDVNLGAVPVGQVQGRKVIISGNLFLGIEYTAAVPSQEQHFAHYNIPFNVMIKARPCTTINRGLLPPNFDINDFNIRICVEHEQHHVVNPRELNEVLVVLIWLEPKA